MHHAGDSAREADTCEFCGRDDVPVCAVCRRRLPHGLTPGTWLPCPEHSTQEERDARIVENALIEARAPA
jgi:hypothetical protein